MDQVIEGVERFQQEFFSKQKELFAKLSHQQQPKTFFICCSDSRMIPELLTQQNPGELFVVRNAGNLVPSYSSFPGGVSASIEYAVAVLNVTDIVICGHSDCGAMKAILNGGDKLAELPSISKWLMHADAAKAIVCSRESTLNDSQKLMSLARENVLAQIVNLRTHPSVAVRMANNRLNIHGWMFDIETGKVEVYDETEKKFTLL